VAFQIKELKTADDAFRGAAADTTTGTAAGTTAAGTDVAGTPAAGTTAAGTNVGIAGLVQDAQGNWVVDPGQALAGTAEAVAANRLTGVDPASVAAATADTRQVGTGLPGGETWEQQRDRLASGTTPMGLEQLRGELYGLQSPFSQFTRLGLTGGLLRDEAGQPVQTPQLSQFGQAGVQDYFGRVIEPRYAMALGQASQQAAAGQRPEFQTGFEEFARQAPGLGRLSGEELRAQQQNLLATLQDRTRTTDPYRQELLSYLGNVEDPMNKRLIGALAAPTLGQLSPYFREGARDRIALQLRNAMLAQPERSLLSLFADTPVGQNPMNYLSPAGQGAFASTGMGGIGG